MQYQILLLTTAVVALGLFNSVLSQGECLHFTYSLIYFDAGFITEPKKQEYILLKPPLLYVLRNHC